MKHILTLIVAFFLLVGPHWLQAQQSPSIVTDSLFINRGEVYFSFSLKNREDIHSLTRNISVDKVRGKTVHAYANKKEFAEFLDYTDNYTILTPPGLMISREELNPGLQTDAPQTTWNFYPNYQQYLDYMAGFVASYPSLCKLDTVGTSTQGRLILVLKISQNINVEEAEPQFLYTSSIHGDELTGYVLMLHLIDYLLANYGTDPAVTNLINTTEICINPLSNPDGTFRGGNNSVYGAVRYNANNIDLNRNFPDPKVGQHPDGNAWQKETEAWMNYAGNNHFIMSANFHGGAEVFNYPWDTWSKLAADDTWWQFVGREWADTVHVYSPAGYFTDEQNGVTNGYAWYELNGGRQDYMNYWHNCREVTLEISNIKLLPASQLLNFWDYNHHSFLNYIRQANYGFSGIVTDTVTDLPVAAKVLINNHDRDNSEVYSRGTTGFYSRPVDEGSYSVTFSAPGYFPKTISDVTTTRYGSTHLDVQLRPLTFDEQDKTESSIMVYPNPSDGRFKLVLPQAPVKTQCYFQVISLIGKVVYSKDINASRELPAVEVDLSGFSPGIYYLRFNSGYKLYIDKIIIRN